jgi:hypothetical protein
MRDTGWVFRASWPILLPDFPLSMLKVEACERIDDLAEDSGCRIAGPVVWSVVGDRLVAQAPAVPYAEPAAAARGANYGARRVEAVRRLVALGWSDDQIAGSLGCTTTAIKNVRLRTARADREQRKGQAA